MSKRFTKTIFSIMVLGIILYQFLPRFFGADAFSTRAYDISRRLTSPDRTKTVVLVRDYAFDLNFRLFVVDQSYDPAPKTNSFLWSSHDYNPDSRINWHEDLQWKKDSSVVAVIINGKYVFAYDFNTNEKVEDEETVKQFLALWHQP